jgi:hypothetical protein
LPQASASNYPDSCEIPEEESVMPKVVHFHSVGAADVLKIEEIPGEQPKAGEVRIKVAAIG